MKTLISFLTIGLSRPNVTSLAVVFVFFLCMTGSTVAENELPSDWDRFRLWDRCRPMDLQVFADNGASEIGLTEDVITRTVRSRLRSAGLYAKGSESELFAGIQVLSFAFQVNVYYQKKLADPISMQVARAITWQDGSFGTHQLDPNYILVATSTLVDGFIDEYLRVNGAVCK